jgi:hypothetical protein
MVAPQDSPRDSAHPQHSPGSYAHRRQIARGDTIANAYLHHVSQCTHDTVTIHRTGPHTMLTCQCGHSEIITP